MRHPIAYPSLGLAVLTGLVVLAWLIGASHDEHELEWVSVAWHDARDAVGWYLIAAIAPCIVMGVSERMLTSLRQIRHSSERSEAPDFKRVLSDAECLIEWSRTDDEIAHPSQALFDHDRVAQRIAKRLQSPTPPTMAVVGPVGAGKSSIRRLVTHHCAQNHRIEIVPVSLWPFNNAEAAVAGILSALVERIRQHVGCISVTGLPDAYIDAAAHVAGKYGVLARFLSGDHEPAAVLRRLGEIATAVGVRFVVWVEDLERFAGTSEFSREEALPIREADRLNPVRSLLYLLDRTEYLSVVVSDVSSTSCFDLDKLARYIERTPPLDADEVAKAIDLLRAHCLSGHPKEIIDPAAPNVRGKFYKPEHASQLYLYFQMARDAVDTPETAICLLVETPRSFKTALRLTWESWEALCGEIDVDDLLLACVLKVTRPRVFALIDDNILQFRLGFRRDSVLDAGKKVEDHSVMQELDRLLSEEPSDRHRQAIKGIISGLFPAFHENRGDSRSLLEKPQGIAVEFHTEYWRRFCNSEAIPEVQSDQALLRTIQQWKKQKPNDLIARLLDENLSRQVECFGGQFSGSELLRLLSECVEAVRGMSATEWTDGDHPPGITSVWRMCHRRNPKRADLAATITELVSRVAADNLPLAHDLVYFFANQSGSTPALMDPEQSASVEASLQAALGSIARGGPGAMKKALNKGSTYTFYWASWGLDRIRKKQFDDLPFPAWSDMADGLLKWIESDPGLGSQVVAPFVTQSNYVIEPDPDTEGLPGRTRTWQSKFDEPTARRLFDFEPLVRALASVEMDDQPSGELATAVTAAVEAARSLLRGLPTQQKGTSGAGETIDQARPDSG